MNDFRLESPAGHWHGSTLARIVDVWSRPLREAGVLAHEPVAILARDPTRAILAVLAVRAADATAVPILHRLAPPEVSEQATRVGARLLLTDAEATLAGIVTATLPAPGQALRVPALVGEGRAVSAEFLLFTSGTSGRPRGVLLSDVGLRAHARAASHRLASTGHARWLASLSMAHVGGLATLVRVAETGGSLVVPAGDADPAEAERVAITHVSLVPSMLNRWIEASPHPPAALRVALVGGAPISPALLSRAQAARWPVRATYGLTEASSQVATALPDSPPGSVGPPLEGVEARVVDEDGRAAPPDHRGRILVRGPGIMRGYHEDPRGTQDALRDGWLWTQDLGRVDAVGNLWILGRLSDVIITGGENVDPLEVEAVLETHPAVREACIVGVPDPVWGERVVAAVVLGTGGAVSVQSLQEHCRGRLAAFKCPRGMRFIAQLPRTGAGKLNRSHVRASWGPP